MEERVVLVDEADREVGTEEKLAAHQKGLLHRAFSVFVFNEAGELLLQQRALTKYHCPGLWSNTVCSHPRLGETLEAAAHRRLQEEMGFDCPVAHRFHLVYRAEFDNGLTEHELDHVFVGHWSGDPRSNPDEVAAFRWITLADLQRDIDANPEIYTPWLRIIIQKHAVQLRR